MIAKKSARAKASHQRVRSPFWVRGVDQPRAPVEERALAVFQPDILVENQYQSTYRRRFYLDPHILPLDDADDIGTAQSAESIEVLLRIHERAGIVPIMKNPLQSEVIEYLPLKVGFLHFS